MGVQSGSFTEGTSDSSDELLRSCEKARIRWEHEGNNGNSFGLPCRPGAAWLFRTMRKAGFSCPQHNIPVLELKWPVGIYVHTACLMQR